MIAAFIAGRSRALVIFMLALNMTVAVGTHNGIIFYVNIVAAKADTYFFCHSVFQSLLLYSYHGLILTSALIFALLQTNQIIIVRQLI